RRAGGRRAALLPGGDVGGGQRVRVLQRALRPGLLRARGRGVRGPGPGRRGGAGARAGAGLGRAGAGRGAVAGPRRHRARRARRAPELDRAPGEPTGLGGEVAWALERFEMGCERGSPFVALTDHLLALRALLEPEGAHTGRLAQRLAAICAVPEQRGALAER